MIKITDEFINELHNTSAKILSILRAEKRIDRKLWDHFYSMLDLLIIQLGDSDIIERRVTDFLFYNLGYTLIECAFNDQPKKVFEEFYRTKKYLDLVFGVDNAFSEKGSNNNLNSFRAFEASINEIGMELIDYLRIKNSIDNVTLNKFKIMLGEIRDFVKGKKILSRRLAGQLFYILMEILFQTRFVEKCRNNIPFEFNVYDKEIVEDPIYEIFLDIDVYLEGILTFYGEEDFDLKPK